MPASDSEIKEPFLRSVKLKNFLSFGDSSEAVELKRLNVLIGPNASGKSNLIEAISLLRATPSDIQVPIREGGGISEWLWKGGNQTAKLAQIEVSVSILKDELPAWHKVGFRMVGQRFELAYETIERDRKEGETGEDSGVYYRKMDGKPILVFFTQKDEKGTYTYRHGTFREEQILSDHSILSQLKDLEMYPVITNLGKQYSRLCLFRERNLGPQIQLRQPQRADLPNDFLLDDAGNLGLVLSKLQNETGVWKIILERLKTFNHSFSEIRPKVEGGTVQIFVEEHGLRQTIPATRLSDGTLRYLCLLTILCHPDPPPLICIEEPELGMHPDIIPTVAEMLIEASTRTQLIVTTHSDTLIDALTSTPESVLVCEKDENGTTMKRLDSDQLKVWLEKYTLGQLWREGEIGGNRW